MFLDFEGPESAPVPGAAPGVSPGAFGLLGGDAEQHTRDACAPRTAELQVHNSPAIGIIRLATDLFRQVHVLILARETGAGKIHVESAMDNGTIATGGSLAEGSVERESAVAALILNVCGRWEKSQATRARGEPRKRRKYYYVLEEGGIGGPVCREGLYDLLAAGKLSWESQVWDDVPQNIGGGSPPGWLLIRRLLGVPSPR